MASEVTALESQQKDLQKLIERGEALDRLFNNKDFKSLILRDYMIDECASYAVAAGDPNLAADVRADALNLALAPGHFKRWLDVVRQMSNWAKKTVGDVEEAIIEARAEEAAQ